MVLRLEENPDADQIDWQSLLDFILTAFDYMDERIDPPSSIHRMTAESLREKASGETLVLAHDNGALAGCMFCRVETRFLYVGKVAVSAPMQGRGIGRQLFERAFQIARLNDLAGLELETRIELTENQKTFSRLGFSKISESAHAGYSNPTSIRMRAILN